MKRTLAFTLLLAFPALAGERAKAPDRKELVSMHEKMAERHQAAADCLKANKPVDECNREAMKGCPMMKSGTCPFMGDMGGMREGMMDKPGKHDGHQGDDKGQKRP